MGRASSGRGGDTLSHQCFHAFVRTTLTTSTLLGLSPLTTHFLGMGKFILLLTGCLRFFCLGCGLPETNLRLLSAEVSLPFQAVLLIKVKPTLSHYLRLVFRGCKLFPLPESLPSVQATFANAGPLDFSGMSQTTVHGVPQIAGIAPQAFSPFHQSLGERRAFFALPLAAAQEGRLGHLQLLPQKSVFSSFHLNPFIPSR